MKPLLLTPVTHYWMDKAARKIFWDELFHASVQYNHTEHHMLKQTVMDRL